MDFIPTKIKLGVYRRHHLYFIREEMQPSEIERKRELLKRLVSFYKDYVAGSAKAVDTLADIQEDFSEFYEIIDRVKSDPTLIEQMMADMPEKDKEDLLLIFIKASMLGERINKLFDLSVEEKRKLANDLREFSKFVDTMLTEKMGK